MAATFIVRFRWISEATERQLQDLENKLKNLHKLLPRLGKIWQEFFANNFRTRGQGSWPPLSPLTLLKKRELGQPKSPLVATGYMRNRATRGAWISASAGGGRFIAFLKVPGYSKFHFGGTRFMPRRDYAFVDNSIDARILAEVKAYLAE